MIVSAKRYPVTAVVQITRREGMVPVGTEQFAFTLHIDGDYIDHYETQADAEATAMYLTGVGPRPVWFEPNASMQLIVHSVETAEGTIEPSEDHWTKSIVRTEYQFSTGWMMSNPELMAEKFLDIVKKHVNEDVKIYAGREGFVTFIVTPKEK